MTKFSHWLLIIVLSSFLFIPSLLAQEKLAQTGFQFLSVGMSSRASAMGEAFSTAEGTSTTLLYNPAGLASITNFVDLSGSWNKWIADISYSSMTLSLSPQKGQYGVFGVSLLWIDYGEFLGTMVWNNEQGYVDTEKFSPKALSVGLGYGKSLTDKFSIGGQVKYVLQTSGASVVPDAGSSSGLSEKKYALSVYAFDFGTIYHTGFKSLNFGMSVRNFSEEIKYEQESFQLPLTFRIGISMNMVDFLKEYADKHSLIMAIDAVHPRAKGEYVCIGLDYNFLDLISLRAGYTSSQDEYNLTYGLGINTLGLAFDYAYIPFGVFDNVQKITLRFSM